MGCSGINIRLGPHPLILNASGNGNSFRTVVYSQCTTTSGWGPNPSKIILSRGHIRIIHGYLDVIWGLDLVYGYYNSNCRATGKEHRILDGTRAIGSRGLGADRYIAYH